jgi:hypothetical protein
VSDQRNAKLDEIYGPPTTEDTLRALIGETQPKLQRAEAQLAATHAAIRARRDEFTAEMRRIDAIEPRDFWVPSLLVGQLLERLASLLGDPEGPQPKE